MPIVFAGGAAIFLWLYEVWIHDLSVGPIVLDEMFDAGAHQRQVRKIGASFSIAAGLVGIVGCALALASNLNRRRYVRA